ncbi:MAG: hypothetical protein ACHP79_15235 [Terriglobales bacterium]
MDAFVNSQLKEWLLLLGFLALWVWIAYIVTTGLRRRQQASMQKALLEKFASAHDFAEFMQSPAGQKYVMSFTDQVTSPRSAILNSIRTGLVLGAMGAGAATGHLGGGVATDVLHTAANILICVGLGFLVSGAIAFFLSKKMSLDGKE